ncbi:MAG: nickel transporter, partial [Acidimicrobiales bacterium]
MRTGHWSAALAVAGIALVSMPGSASAHPLGNFTVNVFSGLRVGPDRVDVELVVDMAEIPAFQARRDADAAGPDYAPRSC